jgi:hypothetical protein
MTAGQHAQKARPEKGNFFYNLLDTNVNKAIMAGSHLG